MQYVPVVSVDGKPLMPCHPARARELVRNGRAVRRFSKGLFYIRLTRRTDGDTQPVVCGEDPGSKKEGFTVLSARRTFLNVQADAVMWVGQHVKTRREMRRARRFRNTPCRPNRKNRARGGIPPSTKARWQFKLNMSRWLSRLYPITTFVVEDVKAKTIGKRKWDKSFSPLEVGKQWFYGELSKIASVTTKQGWETKTMRDALGLKKTSKKMAEAFEAHCVDSWVLAQSAVGGLEAPDNRKLFLITPLEFHRRQLHRLQPEKGGKRPRYGGTGSFGFRRGDTVLHAKYGCVYVGGYQTGRISLHSRETGKRLCINAKQEDCAFLAHASWRTRWAKTNAKTKGGSGVSSPGLKAGVSAPQSQ